MVTGMIKLNIKLHKGLPTSGIPPIPLKQALLSWFFVKIPLFQHPQLVPG